ncbi:MAG TPA: hypothetical protein VJW20_03720 [Candidatus Angelobacter sp.]|nr:hypothetical protein [Candidatus Angelobacter sp.]
MGRHRPGNHSVGQALILVFENAWRKESAMNFIEQLFGLSPDAGSGLTEMLFLLVLLTMIGAFVLRRCVWPSKQKSLKN